MILKKFAGFVTPFRPHFQHSHTTRHIAFVGPLRGLLHAAHVEKNISDTDKEKETEKFVYVGCIHGGSEDIYERLGALVHHPPDYLIFAGDMTGSAEMELLKKKFYDAKEKDPTHAFYQQYQYFGQWAADLEIEKRKALLATLKPAAEKLVAILDKIKQHGTQVLLLEGNWDNPMTSGVKAIARNDIKHVFNGRKFYMKW